MQRECKSGTHYALRMGIALKTEQLTGVVWRLYMLFQLSSLRLAVVLAYVGARISWFLEETPSLVLGERRPAHLREMFVPSSFACPGNHYLVAVAVASHLVKLPPRLGLRRMQAGHLYWIGLVRLRVRVMVVFEIELPLRLPQNVDPLV